MPDAPDLRSTALRLVSQGRGILAADESIKTMSSRLTAAGIPATEGYRRAYRDLLLTAPGLSETVAGVIWCDETFRQRSLDGTPFPETAQRVGILPGIKVDIGTSPLPGTRKATITGGLDGLNERLQEYAALGACFAKWRAVIDPDDAPPVAIEANAHALARYASLCQANGIVPIVEPEVLCGGEHSIQICASVTEGVLGAVFEQLRRHRVDLHSMVLKPNMVTPGLTSLSIANNTPAKIAEASLEVLHQTVPVNVPGIAFLSGGQSTEAACTNLAAMNQTPAPWQLSFSFGRSLVSAALSEWAGVADRVAGAQEILLGNCLRASAATRRAVAA